MPTLVVFLICSLNTALANEVSGQVIAPCVQNSSVRFLSCDQVAVAHKRLDGLVGHEGYRIHELDMSY